MTNKLLYTLPECHIFMFFLFMSILVSC